MKTLLHLTPLAAVGGCEVNCLRLIRGLPDYRHRVVVFDDQGPMSAEWEQSGARVCHLQAWQRGRVHFLQAMGKWMHLQEEPDGVLYWSSSRLPDVLDVLGKWNAPVTVHLGNPLPQGKWVSAARRLCQELRHGARAKTRLAACSEQVARSHRHAFYFRQYPVEVIYNPVEQNSRGPRPHRDLAPGEPLVVGMVGRLDSIKDQLTIIRALADLAPRWPGLVVELAGDGALRSRLEEEAARLGVTNRVRLLGFVKTDSTLPGWDVYVHSTTKAEGMGTAVAEAMMVGLPCIVSDLPVMHEVCANTAEYFSVEDPHDLANILQALLVDRARRVRLGAAAKQRAEYMFSIAQAADAYERLLFQKGSRGETA